MVLALLATYLPRSGKFHPGLVCRVKHVQDSSANLPNPGQPLGSSWVLHIHLIQFYLPPFLFLLIRQRLTPKTSPTLGSRGLFQPILRLSYFLPFWFWIFCLLFVSERRKKTFLGSILGSDAGCDGVALVDDK